MRQAMSLGSSIMKREDDASRGLDPSKNISSSNRFKGSEFFGTMKLL